MAHVVVYSGEKCPYCLRAKLLLDKKGVRYAEYDVRADPARLEEMLAKSGGQQTIPQIFIGGQHIGGCNDLYALEKAGRLDALLED